MSLENESQNCGRLNLNCFFFFPSLHCKFNLVLYNVSPAHYGGACRTADLHGPGLAHHQVQQRQVPAVRQGRPPQLLHGGHVHSPVAPAGVRHLRVCL